MRVLMRMRMRMCCCVPCVCVCVCVLSAGGQVQRGAHGARCCSLSACGHAHACCIRRSRIASLVSSALPLSPSGWRGWSAAHLGVRVRPRRAPPPHQRACVQCTHAFARASRIRSLTPASPPLRAQPIGKMVSLINMLAENPLRCAHTRTRAHTRALSKTPSLLHALIPHSFLTSAPHFCTPATALWR